MADVFESRWNNAVKIANKLNDYFDKGYIIFMDDENDMVEVSIMKYKFRIDDEGIALPIGTYLNTDCSISYFIKDKEMDNGYYTTIKEYNDQFRHWKIVHPKDLKKIRI